jgi:hypothetical protein
VSFLVIAAAALMGGLSAKLFFKWLNGRARERMQRERGCLVARNVRIRH